MYVCMYVCVCVCVGVGVCARTHVYMHVCACRHVHTHSHVLGHYTDLCCLHYTGLYVTHEDLKLTLVAEPDSQTEEFLGAVR